MGLELTGDTVYPIQWELFDLKNDPKELSSVYGHPDYAEIQANLLEQLNTLQREIGDEPFYPGAKVKHLNFKGLNIKPFLEEYL
jgi:hypothetical protein